MEPTQVKQFFINLFGKKLDIYVDSESHGAQVEKVVYFINSKDSCISIRDLDNNENFSDELIEVFNEIF